MNLIEKIEEYLNESEVVKMSAVDDAPKFLKGLNGKVLGRKLSHFFVEFDDFKTPLYAQIYYSSKKNGDSLKNYEHIDSSDVNTKKMFIGNVYYAPTKAAEKRRDYKNIQNDSDASQFVKKFSK